MQLPLLPSLLCVFLCAAKALPPPQGPDLVRRNPTDYGTITTSTESNNPPANLWDYKPATDFSSFIDGLAKTANTSDVKVVIFSSANLDFFLDHIDIHTLSATSPELPPANGTLTGVQLLQTELYLQTLLIIFNAGINGRTAGAGNDIAVQFDIRYAGAKAKLSQLEIGQGELPD